ncbi:cytochrome b [Rhizobium halophytocola]|uniref:Cytochrome b561 n=1 Tax=Rhizobium halophytocola TaxID=735519 RepID=A0ABS4DZ73_9HYPH|nr:cytochrome b/b6 domain-containing protein [Rhizobium halophytocola]MBP1850987.1 cytochrome b561 [Rhizobium halophytocola]
MSYSATPYMLDHGSGYGLVSRGFHWLMALLLTWQFLTALLHVIDRQRAVSAMAWSTHHDVGFLLFVLVLLRGLWGLSNAGRRPAHAGRLGRLASLGHLALYALMAYVPAVALLRQFGSARAFSPFGIPLMKGGGEKIGWMTELGSASHALAAWALLALIGGHLAMVMVHHFVWKDETAARMVG